MSERERTWSAACETRWVRAEAVEERRAAMQCAEIAAATGYSVDHISRIMGSPDVQSHDDDFYQVEVKPELLKRAFAKVGEAMGSENEELHGNNSCGEAPPRALW